MNAPKSEHSDDLARLRYDLPISEFELRQLIAKHSRIVKAASSELAAASHAIIGCATFKLGKFQEAYDHYRIARQVLPSSTLVLCGLGAALLALEKPREAIEPLLAALGIEGEPTQKCVLLGNLAEAFFMLGDHEGAREAFVGAVALGDAAHPLALLVLATQAAELGLSQEALKYFRRFVAVRRGLPENTPTVQDLSPDEESLLRQLPSRALRLLVLKERAWGAALGDLRSRTPLPGDSRQGDGHRVLAEFATLRHRATTAVLRK